MSYYAFFKGWLLLSQPPGCLCLPTSFTTESSFWDLSWRSGLFPSSRRTFSPAVCLLLNNNLVFGVCIGLVRHDVPLAETVLYPQSSLQQGATSIAFGENQLSPSLISLSLLTTTHPLLFQQKWVRASSSCYPTFTLVMVRSPGFGSTRRDYAPYSDSVSLRLPSSVKLATTSNSLTHYTKGTPSLLLQSSDCLYAYGFSSISLPSRGSFHLSLTVLVHYRSVSSI